MKAPGFWNCKPLSIVAFALRPAAWLYGGVGKLRRKITTPYRPSVFTICLGNHVVGGAGKTPTAIAIASLLKQREPLIRVVFLSRGYKGRLKGPVRVDLKTHTARDVGDEPILLARSAPCWVGRDRKETLCEAEKEADIIIMDDGLQNPHIIPHMSLLVLDGAAGQGNEEVFPAGPLRETILQALSRVRGAVLIGRDVHDIQKSIYKPVFRAQVAVSKEAGLEDGGRFLAFAGIGRPDKFYETCRSLGLNLVATCDFDDHHTYSSSDLDELLARAKKLGCRLITTEKDAVKISSEYLSHINVVAIRLAFDQEESLYSLLNEVRDEWI